MASLVRSLRRWRPSVFRAPECIGAVAGSQRNRPGAIAGNVIGLCGKM